MLELELNITLLEVVRFEPRADALEKQVLEYKALVWLKPLELATY